MTSDSSAQRRCACRFARFTLNQCDDPDPRVVQAITLAEKFADGQSRPDEVRALSRDLQPLIQSISEEHLWAHQIEHETLEQSIAYYQTAAIARSRIAVVATLCESAREAVARTAYEARCAIEIKPGIEAHRHFAKIIRELLNNSAANVLSTCPSDVIATVNDDRSLRKCACKFARFALDECESSNPFIVRAIETAERVAEGGVGIEMLHRDAREIRDLADVACDEELESQGRAENDPSIQILLDCLAKGSHARALNAAAATLNESAKEAARQAEYEARWAIGGKASVEAYLHFEQIAADLVKAGDQTGCV